MGKNAVEVKDIKKSFFLPNHKNNSIKSAITQAFKPKDKGGKQFNALNGISFNVEKGDFFGILGRNGSGKSTLLKIISEIYQPTSGSVKHDGKVVSFIELGVGFKAELSGRENVYLNGGLLGFSKQEVDEMYDEIVSFAELEDFMDQKLKNYSSGMKVRLAFSVAIRAKADILILDEVLAVGDASFQKKCTDYFETLKSDGKTVILVTHTMGHVKRFCNKAVVVESGKVIFNGVAEKATEVYDELFSNKNNNDKKRQLEENQIEQQKTGVKLNAISIEQQNTQVDEVQFGKDFIVNVNIGSSQLYEDVKFALHVFSKKIQLSAAAVNTNSLESFQLKPGTNELAIRIQNILPEGEYSVKLAAEKRTPKQQLIKKSNICNFRVVGMDTNVVENGCLAYPNIDIQIK